MCIRDRSHLDGTKYSLTPERSVEIQHLLGSDITMVLDECPKHGRRKEEIAESMRLSLRWASRSKEAFIDRPGYGLFGIVQGNIFKDLRVESARELIRIGFDGYAIGGLAVGEMQKEMFMTLDFTVPQLPSENPRYLMGVGLQRISSVRWNVASTCLTACYRPVLVEQEKGLSKVVKSIFATPGMQKILAHWTRRVSVPFAAALAAPMSIIYLKLMRCWDLCYSLVITSVTIKTLCKVSESLFPREISPPLLKIFERVGVTVM